jgi:hypothetical protein
VAKFTGMNSDGICTKNVLSLLLVLLRQVTVTARFPPVAFAATAKSAVIDVVEFTVAFDTVIPLPAFALTGVLKPRPVIVTLVVPAATPRAGEMLVIRGLTLCVAEGLG